MPTTEPSWLPHWAAACLIGMGALVVILTTARKYLLPAIGNLILGLKPIKDAVETLKGNDEAIARKVSGNVDTTASVDLKVDEIAKGKP